MMVLVGAAGAWLVSRGLAEETHEVESKPDEVMKDDNIDYNEEEPVPPESVTTVGDNITIISNTMTPPPGDMAFKEFPSPNPWHFVDIETDPEAPPGCADTDTASAIKISVEEVPETAGAWPLKGEGNLTPPPGGQGTTAFHWSAKVDKVVLRIVRCYDSENSYNSVYRHQQTTKYRLFLMEDDAGGMINPKLEIALSGGTDRAKVIWRIMDGATKMAEGNFGAGLDVPITFTVTAACKDYVVQVGIDDDNDTHLSDAEAAGCAWVVLDNTSSRPMITAFRQQWYTSAYDDLESDAWWADAAGFDFSSTLLWYFLANYEEPDIPPESPIPFATVAAADSRLTHAVGASPTAGSNSFEGADNSYELIFNASSSPSADILNSGPFKNGVNDLLTTKKADIQNAFAVPGSPDEQVFNYDLDEGVVFQEADSWDLYYALHGAQITAALQVTVKRQGGGLTLARLGVSGSVTDLYDFNYEDGGRAQKGATLQVGWDTAKGRNAGKIFLVKVLLDYTFDNTDWDPFNNWSFDLN